MAAHDLIPSVYGLGTYTDTNFTPVPEECHRVLKELVSRTPGFTTDTELLDGVSFEGSDLPCIPGPIKSPVLAAVLHAMAGIVGHEILQLRGVPTDKKTMINTDQVGLFMASPVLSWIDGQSGPGILKNPAMRDLSQGVTTSPLALRSVGIYPTATPNRWFQLHGSTNYTAILRSIGVEPDDHKDADAAEIYDIIKAETIQYSASELDLKMIELGFPGGICLDASEWQKTSPGLSLARHPLINFNKVPLSGLCTQKGPYLPTSDPKDRRPLAGVKVLELARIIAAPVCGSTLAAMGAEVIRIQTDRLVDFPAAQISSLMAGKTTYNLDLTIDADREKMHELMQDADVVIQGYRLKSLERRGYGLPTFVEMAAKRGKGIIYLDENCYGPDGYYAERPGWQQIADAVSGASYVMGKAFGKGPILPSLPISDMSTGILSALTILCMIRDREKYGGSWHGTASLTAFNVSLLQPWMGLYQPEVVQRIQDRFGFRLWGPEHHCVEIYNQIFEDWKRVEEERGVKLLSNEDLFVHFSDSVYGKDIRILAPVIRYQNKLSSPRWLSPPVPFCEHPMSEAKWQH